MTPDGYLHRLIDAEIAYSRLAAYMDEAHNLIMSGGTRIGIFINMQNLPGNLGDQH